MSKSLLKRRTAAGTQRAASEYTRPPQGSGHRYPRPYRINCDSTRVASLQWLNTGSNVVFTWIGGNRDHDAMEHFPGPDLVAAQTWLMSQVAVLIKRFKDTPEGSGSMLETVCWS